MAIITVLSEILCEVDMEIFKSYEIWMIVGAALVVHDHGLHCQVFPCALKRVFLSYYPLVCRQKPRMFYRGILSVGPMV